MSDSPPPPASWLRSLRTKIGLAMAVVALTVTSAFIVAEFILQRRSLLRDFQVFVRSAAGTTALALDGDSLAQIRAATDAPRRLSKKFVVMLQPETFIGHRYTNCSA